jgi:hypothetical protein
MEIVRCAPARESLFGDVSAGKTKRRATPAALLLLVYYVYRR